MLIVRTLGTLELLDSSGGPLHSMMQRDRRIALLLYLMIAAGDPGLRRDSILPVFWPRMDAKHARASLRQALHLLRSELGPVLEADSGTVRIDHHHVRCDVNEFRAHALRGRLEEALALYHGPFLQGFYISGAPLFERWAESERASVEDILLDCLTGIALRPETTNSVAIAMLLRARAIAPYQEEVVYLLMRRYIAAHNPAMALAAHEKLVRTFRADLEVDVSERMRRFARAIRDKYASV